MTMYTSKPVTVEAEQWDGVNLAAIISLAGNDFIEAMNGRVWIRNAAGPWEIRIGDWVSRKTGGGPLVAHSPDAWARHGFTAS